LKKLGLRRREGKKGIERENGGGGGGCMVVAVVIE